MSGNTTGPLNSHRQPHVAYIVTQTYEVTATTRSEGHRRPSDPKYFTPWMSDRPLAQLILCSSMCTNTPPERGRYVLCHRARCAEQHNASRGGDTSACSNACRLTTRKWAFLCKYARTQGHTEGSFIVSNWANPKPQLTQSCARRQELDQDGWGNAHAQFPQHSTTLQKAQRQSPERWICCSPERSE